MTLISKSDVACDVRYRGTFIEEFFRRFDPNLRQIGIRRKTYAPSKSSHQMKATQLGYIRQILDANVLPITAMR